MPAPAVIPAPIAYIKVVAVKKLVVGFWKFMDVGWDLGGLVFLISLGFICSMFSGIKIGVATFLSPGKWEPVCLGFYGFKCVLFSGFFFWVSPFLLLSEWE